MSGIYSLSLSTCCNRLTKHQQATTTTFRVPNKADLFDYISSRQMCTLRPVPIVEINYHFLDVLVPQMTLKIVIIHVEKVNTNVN